jgi:hypothetical protein
MRVDYEQFSEAQKADALTTSGEGKAEKCSEPSQLVPNVFLSRLTKGLWMTEYAEYMVEGIPGAPYGSDLAYFNVVEANMKRR